MDSVTKFQFDTVFDLDEKGRVRKTAPEPMFSEAEVMAARAEAQQIGYDAGVAQCRREIEHAAAGALQAIAARMPAMAERQNEAMLRVQEEAARREIAEGVFEIGDRPVKGAHGAGLRPGTVHVVSHGSVFLLGMRYTGTGMSEQ